MVFIYQRAAISWGSKKQPTIALSSTEAEIVAAWSELRDRRRRFEPDDKKDLLVEQCRQVWDDWWTERLAKNLTAGQRGKTKSQKTSIFSASIIKTYGSKRMVCGLLEKGFPWARAADREAADADVAAAAVGGAGLPG